MSPKVAENYIGLMASCMIAIENLIGERLLDPQTLEEDYRQIDMKALEDIDLQVGLASILRRGQAYMDRTGKKNFSRSGSEYNTPDLSPQFNIRRKSRSCGSWIPNS